jgi:Tfp pilus assembly protein PilO
MDNQGISSRKSSIIALALLIVGLLIAVLYVRPLYISIGELTTERDEMIELKADLDQKLSDLKELQAELESSSEISKEKSLIAIPEKLEQETLITDLAKIAEKNDMVLGGLNFSIPLGSEPGEISKVGINTNITGNEKNLVSFLKALEGISRKIVVKSISVQTGETESGIPRVNFNLNMEAYFQGII